MDGQSIKLYKHQRELVEKAPDKFLLCHGTGTGKTITSIFLAKKKTDNALVICPKSIKEQWQEYLERFNLNKWLVVTKEELKKKLHELPEKDCLIWDECHYASNSKSQISKATKWYIKNKQPKYIYLLTATPYTSSPWQIYTLAGFLGQEWNFMKFRYEFFQDVWMGNRQIPVIKKGIEPRIAELVNTLGSTVKLEDCIDMPEQIFETEYYDLTPEQKRAINDLEESNHIVRFTRTHQICGGTLKHGGYEPDQYFATHKLDRIKELATQHDKMVIVCRYNAEVKMIHDSLVDKHCPFTITGETKNRHAVVQAVESSSKAIVIVNAACSEGYELPSFPLMVFYSYDFSLKNYEQIKGRIMRINNPKRNVYLSLIVRNTIDADVHKSIMNKHDFQIEIYKKHE